MVPVVLPLQLLQKHVLMAHALTVRAAFTLWTESSHAWCDTITIFKTVPLITPWQDGTLQTCSTATMCQSACMLI